MSTTDLLQWINLIILGLAVIFHMIGGHRDR